MGAPLFISSRGEMNPPRLRRIRGGSLSLALEKTGRS